MAARKKAVSSRPGAVARRRPWFDRRSGGAVFPPDRLDRTGAALAPKRIGERPAAAPARPITRAAAAFFMRNAAFAATRQIYHLCCHSPHWRIGWRLIDGPGVLETGSLNGGRWNILPDGRTVAPPTRFRSNIAAKAIFFSNVSIIERARASFARRGSTRAAPPARPSSRWKSRGTSPIRSCSRMGARFTCCRKPRPRAPSRFMSASNFPRKWRCVGQLLDGDRGRRRDDFPLCRPFLDDLGGARRRRRLFRHAGDPSCRRPVRSLGRTCATAGP